ncbi:RNA-directed DNA polymerase (Reverse transcriptase), Ribonuclease H [Gossypium australe]|uniref:RNA-directed DNA polymerase (Reverse transcriptase), Ribonuclease H n=1 Tax=Gossypium australe TaxID=47621 RepID=A0A5B6UGK1_9ROSI|nr:RNA-directed DNA polymerase (Reverse transcriptase), Ribonuclease H [Gossypium australe]
MKHERRRARLNGKEVQWDSMIFPHISQSFESGGIIHPERGLLESPHINAMHREEVDQRNLLGIFPYEPGSVLNNWTTEELPVVFRDYTESLDINNVSNDNTDPEVHFEQDMCLEEPRDFEGDRDCDLSPDLLRMVKQEEKQILPHEEEVENIALEEGKAVKIGTRIAEETKQELVELLREFKDVFAWSYQDMPGLSSDIVVHRFPIREECMPFQQKLRRMMPDVVLKIKEKVQKQFDAGFLQVVKYLEWVANIVPVPKKDRKVRMCMDYRYLNKASPKDNFPLPHIDTLVDNTIEVYVDDMIAKSQTEKEHIEVLKKLFLRLKKFQLKLNPAKCTFGAQSGKLLGFVVSEKGIEVDSNKVKAIQELPPLRTQKEVRGFLGRLNYIARFISKLTKKCDPIFRFLNKHNQGVWDDECQRAFDKKLNFDGVSNAVGNGIGAILVSYSGDYYPFTCKLDFVCTNNIAEYEACIMGIRSALERKIKVLEVYGDSALVIYQLKGERETRDPKLTDYRKIVLGLIEEFDDITFNYLPRDENQMVDALATLASMIKVNRPEDMRPIRISIFEVPTHCYNVEEEEKDEHPWYQDVLRYVKNLEYPEHATDNEKRTLRRLASDYVLDGDILNKKRKDQVLLRCIDAVEARKILEEVHEGVCGTQANGFTMARQIMRFGYYWSTMEGDCINDAKRCHKCQIYGDKIHVPPSPLHVMTSPLPFIMWGMDVIGPISPKASNGHQFIFVVIDYFTKWVEAASYASVNKSAVSRFMKKEIICRYGMPERIISDN